MVCILTKFFTEVKIMKIRLKELNTGYALEKRVSKLSPKQKAISIIARNIYSKYPYDGKYILHNDRLIICQSNTEENDIYEDYPNAIVNPLGYWTGGVNVDSGATNRKLGSDMGRGVTGGGLHGKDLSKADVSINIFAHILAQQYAQDVEISCSIGDKFVKATIGKQTKKFKYSDIVKEAKKYIDSIGGFEKFAAWGLIRPHYNPIEYHPIELVGQG